MSSEIRTFLYGTFLYTFLMCSAPTGIANVESGNQFRILFVKLSDHSVDLLPNKEVARSSIKPENLVQYHILHEDMLVLIPNHRDTKFGKRHVDALDIDTAIKHLTDQR